MMKFDMGAMEFHGMGGVFDECDGLLMIVML